MIEAVPDCLVRGYEPLIRGLVLPDPDDRHVLAAAVKCGAQAIVTFNLRDFPASALQELEIEALHPDEFVFDLIDLGPAVIRGVVEQQAAALRRPPKPAREVLAKLEQQGLPQSVARLRELVG